VVEFSLDIRAPTSIARDKAVHAIVAEIEAIAARRKLTTKVEVLQELAESPSDPALTRLLEDAVRSVGVAPRRLPSGAGHDSMVIADLCPTAMLFIRCKDGISHNPAEAVAPEDARLAAQAMAAFVERLAQREQKGAGG
jgi:allantoate deiminase